MKKFNMLIEGENVVLQFSTGEIEAIRLNGGACFNLYRDNKLVLKIESPMVGANWLPLDHGESQEPKKICAEKITAMKDGRFLIGGEIVHDGAIIRMDSPGDYFVIELCSEKSETKAVRKNEPKKNCGTCRHVVRQVMFCKKKRRSVPALHNGCSDFEPRTGEKSALERLSAAIESGAEAAVRDELVWQFKQLMNKIEMLQDQNDWLRKKLDAAIEERNSAIRRFAEQVKQVLAENQKNLEREANKRN